MLSTYLIGHDTLFLMRCVDDCKSTEIVRSWGSRPEHTGPDILAFVTIPDDGDYFFVPKTFAVTLQHRNLQACVSLLRLHEACSDAMAMTIKEVKSTPELFRVRLKSGSWIWVRKVSEAASLSQATNAKLRHES